MLASAWKVENVDLMERNASLLIKDAAIQKNVPKRVCAHIYPVPKTTKPHMETASAVNQAVSNQRSA